MCPAGRSLRSALKGASPGATEPMHSNYSSAGKTSASLCLAAYLESISYLCTKPQGSGIDKEADVKARESMSQRDMGKTSKEKGGRKANTCNWQAVTEHTRLRLSQETQASQKPAGDRTHEGCQCRALSRENVQVLLLDGLLSYHLPMFSCWSACL